ncbi:uclacyanin-3-like [Phragmites australis]|uniref:uclacyanin-3-like n=1 Tax=Phragmites australis TaxID=29695 RepID=UPI002D76ACF6|nr:uclacyanin-3-like [Phragmites australis]
MHQSKRIKRKIHACMGCNCCFHKKKRISKSPAKPTHSWQQSRDLTNKQPHDQDLNSRPAFEFALLKEQEQKQHKNLPSPRGKGQERREYSIPQGQNGHTENEQGTINNAPRHGIVQAKQAQLNSFRLLYSWHLFHSFSFASFKKIRGCELLDRRASAAMAMGARNVLVLALGLAMAATSSAVIYKAGDTSGWTILGNVNYTDWTAKKTFHVGDTIEFQYPKGIHNVLEVKKADYDSCTNSSPIATHTSGDDKIVIKSPGHRFFICGVPGHCAAGQKVDIRVLKPRSSDAPSTAPTASASAPAPAPALAAASPGGGSEPSSASSPPPAATTDSSPDATTTAPEPNANGAGASAGYGLVVVAMALAAVASVLMLQ